MKAKYALDRGMIMVFLMIILMILHACSSTPATPSVTTTARTTGNPLNIQTTTVIPSNTPVVAETNEQSVSQADFLPSPTPTPTDMVVSRMVETPMVFLPAIIDAGQPTATNTPTPALLNPEPTKKPTRTPYPTIDFVHERTRLADSGQDLGFVKIGFHVGVGGNLTGLGEWMTRLDEAGVPFFLKSVDYAGPLYEAQELIKASGVPHVLVYRSTIDVPNYDLPPVEAARQHWETHRALFPPELDKELVWIETVNEVDKNRSEWLAQFAMATADITLAEGYRWAAFGWSSGEPEIENWNSPSMLSFLGLVAQYPERLAIATHEYSYTVDDIAYEYPYHLGHFLHLFQVCDENGIKRPTVLITEWGWTYNEVPSVSKSMRHIEWASSLYAPYPEVKGAAIWHLGGGKSFSHISDQAQKLIEPLTEYSLTHYFSISSSLITVPADPELYRP